MAKNRVIPFGYCMKNGEITTEPREVYAVATIFSEYINDKSLSEIAKQMKSEKIQYSEDAEHWNKNIVKRIIENEKYLGTEKYPQIIDDETFRFANEKRVRKATTLNLISDDLQEIRKVTYCAECGYKLSRIGGNSKYEHWDCRNPDCYKLEYRLTDQMIIGAVLNVLNSAIANPSLLESGGEISTYFPDADVIRKQNEINQMTDSLQIDFDRVKAEIFKLAEMKYDCCTYNDSPQKTEELKATELLICGHCGTPYRRTTWASRGKKQIVWRCISRLEHGKKYCPDSPTIKEESLHKAIIHAINNYYSCRNDIARILKTNIGTVLECQGQEEIISIENRLKEVDKARNDLVGLIASGGCDEDKLDSEFAKLYGEEQQLSERLTILKSQNKTSAETQAKLDKIMDMIEHEKFELETFDNVLIRKLTECVKVLSKTEILVIFKGGYEVKAEIE